MRKRYFSIFVLIAMLFSCVTVSAESTTNNDIIVLYESLREIMLLIL
ncbi:hypothetical protein [Clostridium sp. MD294]|nr:hypothetical protein [Clostridium sp. MD294]USF30800.1 hypothetical protein C820_002243 [Clostridium sp. MD294]